MAVETKQQAQEATDPRLTVLLPLPLKRELAAVAEAEERSMGSLVRLAVRGFLADRDGGGR